MAHRENGTLITHNTTHYVLPPLMPGYCGHIPGNKLFHGETFGHATTKCFQDNRSRAMDRTTRPYGRGGMFPSVFSNRGPLVTAQRMLALKETLNEPHWSRYNVDHNRQEELKTFRMLCQEHRDKYKDRTGTKEAVNYFVLPVPPSNTYQRERIPLPYLKSSSVGVRRYQTLPSGIRTTLDDRIMRNIYFQRR